MKRTLKKIRWALIVLVIIVFALGVLDLFDVIRIFDSSGLNGIGHVYLTMMFPLVVAAATLSDFHERRYLLFCVFITASAIAFFAGFFMLFVQFNIRARNFIDVFSSTLLFLRCIVPTAFPHDREITHAERSERR